MDFAILSSSSFFLTAYESVELLLALMSSSARHSAIVRDDLKADFLQPSVMRPSAWFTLLSGDTSHACLRTVPPTPIRVESSLAPQYWTALTNTTIGFSPVDRLMRSNAG